MDSASACVLEFMPQTEAQASRLLVVREWPVVSANGHVNANVAACCCQPAVQVNLHSAVVHASTTVPALKQLC